MFAAAAFYTAYRRVKDDLFPPLLAGRSQATVDGVIEREKVAIFLLVIAILRPLSLVFSLIVGLVGTFRLVWIISGLQGSLQRLGEVEQRVVSLTGSLQAAEQKIQKQEGEQQALEASLREKEAELAQLRGSTEALQAENVSLQQQINLSTGRIKELDQTVQGQQQFLSRSRSIEIGRTALAVLSIRGKPNEP